MGNCSPPIGEWSYSTIGKEDRKFCQTSLVVDKDKPTDSSHRFSGSVVFPTYEYKIPVGSFELPHTGALMPVANTECLCPIAHVIMPRGVQLLDTKTLDWFVWQGVSKIYLFVTGDVQVSCFAVLLYR